MLTTRIATSIVVPSSMDVSIPYTNGHAPLSTLDAALSPTYPPPSDSGDSDAGEAAAASSDEEDADGEDYNEEDQMEIDEAESSEDAEGEADSDFGSETSPQEEERRRARSSTSAESNRPVKRKASVEDDFSSHPELYGLRRSVRGLHLPRNFLLTGT